MNKFTKTIRDFLIDELADARGYDFEAYDSYEIAQRMTEGINATGSVHCSTYRAKEFIQENCYEFGEVVKFYHEEFSELLNPFLEPEKAEVIAYILTCERLLAECKELQRLFDESEGGSLTVNESVIDGIIKELDSIDIDVF